MDEIEHEEIVREIRERGLEEVYLRELVASLGFDPTEGWNVQVIAAFEKATYVQRRRAALRTIGREETEEEREE